MFFTSSIFNDYANLTSCDSFTKSSIKRTEGGKIIYDILVPGFGKEDLDVTVSNNVVNIIGKTEEDSFTKKFRINKSFVLEGASVENGILKLTFSPLEENEDVRRIEIK